MRIVYSPTSKVRLDNYKDTCTGKGFKRTYRILMNFVTKFKDKVEIRVFSGGRPKREVLEAKAISDVVIDECVTGSYHLSSLEGLSTENIVIGNLMPEVKDVICEVSGSPREKLPWIECEIDNLYETLYKLMMLKFNDYVKFINRQLEGRIWMKEYWHPQNLVKHITKIYDKALNVENNPWKGLGVSSNIERVRDFRKKSHALYTKSKDLDIDYRTNIGFPNVPALILGNGPSLLRCDINSLLKNKNVIFTCNYFYKYFTDLIPDYWTCIDSTCLKECLGNVPLATKILINPPPIYTEIKHKRIWIDKFNGYFDHKFETERPCTVATIMVLFALYLRCDPIYIAGVDLSLEKTDKNYAYDDPVYNKKFRDFSNNYLHIIKEFKLIREEAKLRGVKIYNLDPEPKNFNVFEVADASIISQK